jgi:hypothetical protein
MEFHCNCHDTDHEGCKLEQPEQSGPLVLCHGVSVSQHYAMWLMRKDEE